MVPNRRHAKGGPNGCPVVKRLIGVILVSAAVLGGVAVPAISGGSEKSDRPAPNKTFSQRLTAHERAQTRRIVARDLQLRHIIGGHDYAVKTIGLWEKRALRHNGELLHFLTVT
jgi:hypothetical protein